MENKIKKLLEFLEESNNIVFFGGAGVSTESGIPDFRSKNGLYNQMNIQSRKFGPEYFLSRECLYNDSKVFYEFYRENMDVRGYEPNITHKVLAKLEELGKIKAVVTQNIDGLHQKAGSKNVFEIHGTTQKCNCNVCKKIYDKDYIFKTTESVPKCECGGIIRPSITLYGEKLPKDAVEKSCQVISEADMLIIAGTSLSVYPALNFINEFEGNHIVVINKEELDLHLDKDNDLFFCESMGTIFEEIDKYIEEKNYEQTYDR